MLKRRKPRYRVVAGSKITLQNPELTIGWENGRREAINGHRLMMLKGTGLCLISTTQSIWKKSGDIGEIIWHRNPFPS